MPLVFSDFLQITQRRVENCAPYTPVLDGELKHCCHIYVIHAVQQICWFNVTSMHKT